MDQTKTKEQLNEWLKDEVNIQLFYQFLTEKEAKPEDLFNSPLFLLKKGKKRSEFVKASVKWLDSTNLQSQQLRQNTKYQDKDNPSFLTKFKNKCIDTIKTFSEEDKCRQELIISLDQQLLQVFKQEMQQTLKDKQQLVNDKISNSEKLENLINKILEVYDKAPDNSIHKTIMTYGTFDALRSHKYFQSNDFRQKFQSLLQLSISYSQIRKYGGRDIQQIRIQMIKHLESTLININLSPKLIYQITNQLKQKPLSNCISNHKQLTLTQKINYYNSKFYKSGELNNYAQILLYPQSIHSNALKDISLLMQLIKGNSIIVSDDIVKKALKFDFIKLLSVQNISICKKIIFNSIKQKCPNFYKAYLSIYYQGKSEESLKLNERFQKIFKLRNVFIEAQLKFQDWQYVEAKIMDRKQAIINDLDLSINHKYIIRRFYLQQLQPYFHRIEKPIEYKNQIEELLISQIMNKPFQKNKDMQQILEYINQMIQLLGVKGQLIQSSLKPKDINQLNQIVKKSQKFQQYINNKGFDKSEDQYQAKQNIKKLIYQINYQNHIQVSYNAIQQLIQYIVTNGFKIPIQYKTYVCDLKTLKNRFSSSNQPEIDSLVRQRDQLLKQCNKYLLKNCPEKSLLVIIQKQSFDGRQNLYCQLLLNLNPFQTETDFTKELGISNGLKINRFKKEAKEMNTNQIKDFLNKYKLLDQQIKKIDPSLSSNRIVKNNYETSPEKQNKQSSPKMNKNKQIPQKVNVPIVNKVQQQKKLLNNLNEVLNNFKNQLKNSGNKTTIKIMETKFQDQKIFLERILKSNPFQNPESSTLIDELKTELIITGLQIKPLKAQFINIAGTFGKKYANDYANLISDLRKLKE